MFWLGMDDGWADDCEDCSAPIPTDSGFSVRACMEVLKHDGGAEARVNKHYDRSLQRR